MNEVAEAAPAAMVERLRRARGFVFDLDGTLVLGDRRNASLRPLPGAIELTSELAARGVPFVILTNGTVRTPEQYAATLRSLGFPLQDRAMLTPASVAADYLAQRRLRRVLVLGGEGIAAPLAAAGLVPTLVRERRSDVDAIFCGWFREFGIEDLEVACEAAAAGARLYAASMSPFFATAEGRTLGTSRAIVSMITSLTGRRGTVLGKPSLAALRIAAQRLGLPAEALAVIGDDPELETPMAHRGRALAIGVHSAVAGAAGFEALPEPSRPHLTVPDMAQLHRLYVGS